MIINEHYLKKKKNCILVGIFAALVLCFQTEISCIMKRLIFQMF